MEALKKEERDLGTDHLTKRQTKVRLAVGIYPERQTGWLYREGSSCGERFHTTLWHRLSRDVFSCKLTKIPYEAFWQLQLTDLAWSLHQLDVKKAFLHGDLHTRVYIRLTPGFRAQGEEGQVWRWRRGSHISPRLLGLGSRYEGYDEDGFPEKECWSLRVNKKETRGNYSSPSVLSLELFFHKSVYYIKRQLVSKSSKKDSYYYIKSNER